MIEQVPFWLDILFIACTLFSMYCFYQATGKAVGLLVVILAFGVVQSILAYNGFYVDDRSIPPRFLWVLLPSTLLIIYGLTPKVRARLNRQKSTVWSVLLHSVRLPVEIVLFVLYTHKMVPQLMTFEGRNFDIVMGITAPIMGFLLYRKRLSKRAQIVWHVIGTILISFILINGILSAELPIQQFAFDQPNVALTYFPYVLLPSIIVPIVIYSHIADLFLLLKDNTI